MTTESEANGGGSAFEGWGVLELFGHRRLGGYVSEQELAGQAFVRIDVPDRRGPVEKVLATQLYHPNAVYALTPCGESEARAWPTATSRSRSLGGNSRALLLAATTRATPARRTSRSTTCAPTWTRTTRSTMATTSICYAA